MALFSLRVKSAQAFSYSPTTALAISSELKLASMASLAATLRWVCCFSRYFCYVPLKMVQCILSFSILEFLIAALALIEPLDVCVRVHVAAAFALL